MEKQIFKFSFMKIFWWSWGMMVVGCARPSSDLAPACLWGVSADEIAPQEFGGAWIRNFRIHQEGSCEDPQDEDLAGYKVWERESPQAPWRPAGWTDALGLFSDPRPSSRLPSRQIRVALPNETFWESSPLVPLFDVVVDKSHQIFSPLSVWAHRWVLLEGVHMDLAGHDFRLGGREVVLLGELLSTQGAARVEIVAHTLRGSGRINLRGSPGREGLPGFPGHQGGPGGWLRLSVYDLAFKAEQWDIRGGSGGLGGLAFDSISPTQNRVQRMIAGPEGEDGVIEIIPYFGDLGRPKIDNQF